MTTLDPHTGGRHLVRGRKASALGMLAGGAWALAMVLGVLVFALVYCLVNGISLVYRLGAAGLQRIDPRQR